MPGRVGTRPPLLAVATAVLLLPSPGLPPAAATGAVAAAAVALVPWICVPSAHAASATTEGDLYTVQPGTSRVTFFAHATGHDFTGTTPDVRGNIRFDPASLASTATGEVRVKASTLDTGIDRRNRKMWELLEAEKNPDIIFTLERVSLSEPAPGAALASVEGSVAPPPPNAPLPSQATLAGSLEVRGVRKPLAVPVEIEPAGDAFVVRGSFPADLRDFGIEPPRAALIIRMQPGVRVEFEARFQKVP